MARFRSVRTGVTVDVDDDTAATLSRHFWEPAADKKSTSTRKGSTSDKK
jgi:hypothetical protein